MCSSDRFISLSLRFAAGITHIQQYLSPRGPSPRLQISSVHSFLSKSPYNIFGRNSMSSRLSQILSHITASSTSQPQHPPWYHPLNPTYFLPRAASIYGPAQAVQHRTSVSIDITRTYDELSSRAAGLAYFLREQMGLKRGDRVAIVSPNTPMFLESFFGIAGAGCITLCVNYKLTSKGAVRNNIW